MTSRNLFFKLQKEDLKRRIWTIALAILVFFLSFLVTAAMMIGNFDQGNQGNISIRREDYLEQIISFMQPQAIIIFITITGAVICGLSGFFYLQSKKKVDLYHSVPVRREILFTISYLDGLLIYLVPYIISILLCFIIFQTSGFMNAQVFFAALSSVGISLLYYTLIYTITVIAVMLTGNIIISCFGTAVFMLYGTLITLIKQSYFQEFFATYYNNNDEGEWSFLSPVGSFINTANKISDGSKQGLVGTILLVIILSILFIGLALYLYIKRPSEAAGKSMAFGITRPVIKLLLTIPLTMSGGIIFKSAVRNDSVSWFIFGLIFTFFIIYAIIEIIYNFDIRSAFNHKKQMLLSAGMITLITCIFQFDLFRYDFYLPDKDKVESMSVAFSELDGNIRYFEWEGDRHLYRDSVYYQLKHMELKDFDTAYQLADLGIQQTDKDKQTKDRLDVNKSYDINNEYTFYIKYTLKGGRTVYRSYQLNKAESFNMMQDIYAKKEFKETHFPIYKLDEKNEKIGEISCFNELGNKEFSLSNKEKEELIETYKAELNNLTLMDMIQNYPLATLSIMSYEEDSGNTFGTEYYIYPTFTNTIDFLKKHGFDAAKKAEAKDIINISINNYNTNTDDDMYDINIKHNYDYKYKYNEFTSKVDEAKSNVYKLPEQIEEIYPNLISKDYYLNNRSIINLDDSVEVMVLFKLDQFGNESNYSYYFTSGKIPEFVKKDINYKQE
jgi:ABC-2 type transport system permease protein